MASRGAARGGEGRAAAVMEWEGGSAGERASEHSRPGIEHGGSGAARHRGRGTAASARAARSSACARAERGGQRGRERGERKREWREKLKVHELT